MIPGFGCLRRLLGLGLLLVLLGLAWYYRAELRRGWRELRGLPADPQPSAELAMTAEDKLAALADGPPPERVTFTEAEVQSLLEYRFRNMLPEFVSDARVELDGEKIRLRGRVPTERLPRLGELDEVLALLPDTTEVVATGQLVPLDSARVAFAVDELSTAKIPLPRRVIPTVLRRLGRADAPGLPRDAVAVPLPPGTSAAYVRGDSLVFLARASARTD